MSMLDLCAELGQAAAAALRQAFPESSAIAKELTVQAASKPEFGDLQIAGCLPLAKPLAKKPRDLAQIIVDSLRSHPALAKVEIAGPGYVNLHLCDAYIEQQLEVQRSDPHHGVRQRFAGQRVVIDFSSPNVAKPMHIGHIRSTIIGDALARILRAAGYTAITDNHLGDWGTQFGKLIVAYRRWLDPVAYAATPIAELVRLYQKFVTEEKQQGQELGIKKPDRKLEAGDGTEPAADEDEGEAQTVEVTPLIKEARSELVKLQNGDAANLKLWGEFVEVSLGEFSRTYKRLDVHFDTQHGESFFHPRLASLVEDLLQKRIAEHSRGAVICVIEGEPAPLLIRKADGSFLYGTTDVATIEYRLKEYQPSRILYVVGSPQILHFRQVFAVAHKLLEDHCSLEHLTFGSMRFRDSDGNWATGSTRLGNVPLLDEFIDAAIARARSVAESKNAELSAAELDEVARVVGIGAIKYNDLARDRQSDIHFDLDKALALEGNTAPYLQYAYARLRSIARRAAVEGAQVAATPRIVLPAERALARRLLDYGAIVERVAETCRPHTLCDYLYELSGAVSTFYNEVPVMKATPDERAARLLLLELTASTLKHGLALLGIEVPERM